MCWLMGMSGLIKFLTRILEVFITELSKNIDYQLWLQKICESRIIGKVFVKTFSSLDIGMTIHTFMADGKLIPTSSLMFYEPKTMRAFAPHRGDVVVDVGAYVGRYTLRASKKVGNTGVVIAIEPKPNAYRVLLQNLKLNRAKNVRPINVALSNYDGVCKLYSRGRPGLNSTAKKTDKATIVPCRTLDSLLDELDVTRVDWIKVDVEGAEYEVLRGMMRTLEKNKSVKCIFEIHHSDEVDPVKPKLMKMGFEILHTDWYHILAFRPN